METTKLPNHQTSKLMEGYPPQRKANGNHATIIFAGGGSVGHVAPSLAVAEEMAGINPAIKPFFVCSHRQEEIELIKQSGFKFVSLHAGKFPRGISAGWLTFPVVFAYSFASALKLLKRIRPKAVFSKGGFISAPVCLAARMFSIPVILHESDAVTGMSNALIARIAVRICLGFPPAVDRPVDPRVIFTGNPVRAGINQGSKDAGKRITGFSGRRPVIMVIGGSQGARALNEVVAAQLDELLAIGDVIHLTGKGKGGAKSRHARYWAKDFVMHELKHLYAMADIVVSRAGAGAITESSACNKAVIVVPLRGLAGDHQWINAKRLAAAGAVHLLEQENLGRLAGEIRLLLNDHQRLEGLKKGLSEFFPPDSATRTANIVLDASGD